MIVTVPTSDRYVDIIPGFAYCFNKYWGDNIQVDILCYNKFPKKPLLPDNFNLVTLGKQEDFPPESWTNALIPYYEDPPHHGLKDDLMIVMMDDFFLSHPVNQDHIKTSLTYFEDPDVVKFDLTDDRIRGNQFEEYEKKDGLDVVLTAQNANYRSSLQAAIWRREYFLSILKPDRNPWQFELKGMKELMNDGKKILGTRNHPVKYANMILKRNINPKEIAKLNPIDLKHIQTEGLFNYQ